MRVGVTRYARRCRLTPEASAAHNSTAGHVLWTARGGRWRMVTAWRYTATRDFFYIAEMQRCCGSRAKHVHKAPPVRRDPPRVRSPRTGTRALTRSANCNAAPCAKGVAHPCTTLYVHDSFPWRLLPSPPRLPLRAVQNTATPRSHRGLLATRTGGLSRLQLTATRYRCPLVAPMAEGMNRRLHRPRPCTSRTPSRTAARCAASAT